MRVQVIGGPWPERIGCVGEALPKMRDEYPWNGLGLHEVVLRLDYDPLTVGRPRSDWTCVMRRTDLRSIE